ncbi:MAG TPA: class I SAM-dependent RNA methyltransferase [Lentimicrobium sp.]|nr:class I SAM-dependent RNA methyltransferase [Lentimicrobium sp.]
MLKSSFLAKSPAGLEEVLAQELSKLGASSIEILKRAVSFDGDQKLLYKANYHLRTALRVLVPVKQFTFNTENEYYDRIRAINWEYYIENSQTLAIDSTISDSIFTHSHFVSQRTKDAIADRFRERTGNRPSVDLENPDLRINIHIYRDTVNVSLDSSGASLHKRGYHSMNAEAPLSEVLGAGMIMLTGWNGESNFIDWMCGSGTLLIEAAMIAMNLPAGQFRDEFGFMKWKDFSPELWRQVKEEALDQQKDTDIEILGSDISAKNLKAAEINIRNASLHKDIRLKVADFKDIRPPQGKGILVSNPPYGERIQVDELHDLYKEMGNALKRNFEGYQAWLISSDQRALKLIGLRPMAKKVLWNGQLECRFVGFDLYHGSKKDQFKSSENELI